MDSGELLLFVVLEVLCLFCMFVCRYFDWVGIVWCIVFVSLSLGGLWVVMVVGFGIVLCMFFGCFFGVWVLDVGEYNLFSFFLFGLSFVGVDKLDY